jgi:ABC-type glycerol-3-phosphate transport system substrate-binding protein
MDPNFKATLAVEPDNRPALYTKMVVDKFEADNPGKSVMLRFQGAGEGLNQSITQAIISKEAVDLVQGEVYVQKLIDGEFFSEIEGDYKSKIAPFLYDKYNTADKAYAIPVFTGSFALFVNRTTLNTAGVIKSNGTVTDTFAAYADNAAINPLAPATLEDMLTVCEFIQEKYYDSANARNGNIGGTIINDVHADSQWRALAFMRLAGGDFADDNGGVTLDSPANRKAFDMMQRLNNTAPRNSHGKTYTNDVFNYFYENKIAYMLEGSSLATRAPEECDYSVVELPVFAGADGIKSNVVVGTAYYSVPAHSKKQDLSKKFIEQYQIY